MIDSGASQTDYTYTDSLTATNLDNLRIEDKDAALPLTYKELEASDITVKQHKKPISIRLDQDVLDWFKARGKGYQTTINVILRSYMISKQM